MQRKLQSITQIPSMVWLRLPKKSSLPNEHWTWTRLSFIRNTSSTGTNASGPALLPGGSARSASIRPTASCVSGPLEDARRWTRFAIALASSAPRTWSDPMQIYSCRKSRRRQRTAHLIPTIACSTSTMAARRACWIFQNLRKASLAVVNLLSISSTLVAARLQSSTITCFPPHARFGKRLRFESNSPTERVRQARHAQIAWNCVCAEYVRPHTGLLRANFRNPSSDWTMFYATEILLQSPRIEDAARPWLRPLPAYGDTDLTSACWRVATFPRGRCLPFKILSRCTEYKKKFASGIFLTTRISDVLW